MRATEQYSINIRDHTVWQWAGWRKSHSDWHSPGPYRCVCLPWSQFGRSQWDFQWQSLLLCSHRTHYNPCIQYCTV